MTMTTKGNQYTIAGVEEENKQELPNFFTITEEYTKKFHYIKICPYYLQKVFFNETELKLLGKYKNGQFVKFKYIRETYEDHNMDFKIYSFLEKYSEYRVNVLPMATNNNKWYGYRYIFQKK